MNITLNAWASKNFDPPPKQHILRSWIKSSSIQPEPIKVGNTWYVDSEAEYIKPSVSVSGLSDAAKRVLQCHQNQERSA